MAADPLVEDYLRRLEDAAAHLPEDRRTELVQEIGEHIDHALSETGTDELAVRNALERLGPPEEIVAAAEPTAPPQSQPAPAKRPWLEIAAVVALLIPFAGWLVGLVLVVLSRVWSNREKALGLGLILAAILLPAIGFMATSADVSSSPVPVGEPVEPATSDDGPAEFVVIMLAGLPAAVFLGWRLSLRRSSV